MKRKKYKYPIYKKSKINGCVVKFTGLHKGIVVEDTKKSQRMYQHVGALKECWIEHTDSMIWKDIKQ